MAGLNQRETRMLQWIAHIPREANSFCSAGTMGLSPRIAEGYLAHLCDLGFVDCDDRGVYRITDIGTAYLARPTAAPSRLWGPWSTPAGSYEPARHTVVRAGADDHLRFHSRGV